VKLSICEGLVRLRKLRELPRRVFGGKEPEVVLSIIVKV
jgi:hypothetical protein